MRADRKVFRSTKLKIVDMTTESTNLKNINPVRANAFCDKIVDLNGKLHADQTGHFHVTSRKLNKHPMIAHDWDSNFILACTLKSKTAHDHLKAIKSLCQFLNQKGTHPKIHILDNECSHIVEDCIKHENVFDLLLTPPHLNRTNAAEKAIDICENKFIIGLATVNPSFPLHL